ncbi:SURF1 family protein [Aurantiacibacter spongiae]|uniref:SURF1-like protein n=1 Tax=Aurantiacibacter spongiae TaxID=2488860 RepID=A0A3N5CQF4_9SPHN|nr:SURF1 family protein [Aurantiacibacter spongiae]RPF70837.1 SURF1 family protein [Aurantiacibacter spongiae]
MAKQRRRIPVLPTILVVAAAIVMVGLGVWQLQRREEKEALIAASRAALASPRPVSWQALLTDPEAVRYRRTELPCTRVTDEQAIAGRNRSGEPGWAHRVRCAVPGGDLSVPVDIGWSRRPDPVGFAGGLVSGTVAPGGRVVADTAPTGLEPLARPDPADLPNNHLAYAGQWFFFALTALVIYGLTLRRRWREGD